jgi:hypothetical protein
LRHSILYFFNNHYSGVFAYSMYDLSCCESLDDFSMSIALARTTTTIAMPTATKKQGQCLDDWAAASGGGGGQLVVVDLIVFIKE